MGYFLPGHDAKSVAPWADFKVRTASNWFDEGLYCFRTKAELDGWLGRESPIYLFAQDGKLLREIDYTRSQLVVLSWREGRAWPFRADPRLHSRCGGYLTLISADHRELDSAWPVVETYWVVKRSSLVAMVNWMPLVDILVALSALALVAVPPGIALARKRAAKDATAPTGPWNVG